MKETIQISITTIAAEMKKRGFTEVKEGWSDSLLDILEETYSIETNVVEALKEADNG